MSKAKQMRRKAIKTDLALGKRTYVLQRGVIGWGMPTFLLYLVINTLVQTLFFRNSFGDSVRQLFPFPILMGLVIFGIAGMFLGNYRWKQLLKEAGGKYRTKKK